MLGFILLTLGAAILWFGWEDAVLYSEAVYTRPGDALYDEFAVNVPSGAREPYTVLVALHGIGGSGQRERLAMRQQADAQGWVTVSPTFPYRSEIDSATLAADDRKYVTRLAEFLDTLPERIHGSVNKRVLIYGFSRGAQTGHRFALVYPERVERAAIVAGGSYTLPAASFGESDSENALDFPFGVADFASVFNRPFDSEAFVAIPFWIGVGAQDTIAAEIPREWDPYLGSTRVERARRFATWLDRSHVRTQFEVFPRTGHEETNEIRIAAVHFLASTSGGPVPTAAR